MADYHGLLGAFRARTTPDPEKLDRVRGSLRRPRGKARVAVGTAFAFAAAAAAVLLWPTRPDPVRPLATPGPVVLSELVRAEVEGEGLARRDGDHFDLTWTRGTLALDVEPHRGVDLTVTTDEAVVRVVGTVFSVHRDALGTTVQVERGEVATDCALGGPSRVRAGESRTCLPRTAAGALGRVRALDDGGAAPEVLLDEIEQALSRPDAAGAVANELGSLRVGALLRLERSAEALAAAEATLASAPGGRDPELRRVAARLHVANGDCAGALPHLRALADAGALGPDTPLFDRCSTEAP